MNVVKLKSELKRYSYKGNYTLCMAKRLVLDVGYTVRLCNKNAHVHKVMYDGRHTGVSLIETTKSWFVV